jgi:predicted exporter
MKNVQQILPHSDTVVGAAAAAAGSAGITLQIITEYASLAVISLNLVLAIGGIYVLFLRSKAIKKSLK